jgi:serine/threonine protein phosphatase 1
VPEPILQRILEEWPSGLRVFAIGDIHGRADLLRDLHARIDALSASDPRRLDVEVVLGDMIDRGPDSRGVLDLLLARRQSHSLKLIRGNHEAMALRVLREPAALADWLRFGGLDTLASYGVMPAPSRERESLHNAVDAFRQALPGDHLALLETLDLAWELSGFLFVHAGIMPGLALAEQSERDLLEIREPFLGDPAPHHHFVIHGHTPVADVEIHANRANVDTGAFATGCLSCLVIDRDGLSVIRTGTRPGSPAIMPQETV